MFFIYRKTLDRKLIASIHKQYKVIDTINIREYFYNQIKIIIIYELTPTILHTSVKKSFCHLDCKQCLYFYELFKRPGLMAIARR